MNVNHFEMKALRTITILLALGLLSATRIMAQPMSLRDCMDYAIEHSTAMRLSAADRSDEQAARTQAALALFTPSVNAQSYAYNQYGRNLDPETNTYTDFTTFHNGNSLSGGITLFSGFQTINKLRLAQQQMVLGLSKEQQSADEVRFAVMEAYYKVVYYDQLVEVLQLQTSTADSALLKAQREEQLGRKGHADVVQMEAELSQRQYQLINASNQYEQALMTLKETLCWPMEKELEVAYTEMSETSLHSIHHDSTMTQFEPPSIQLARGELHNAELQLAYARGNWSPSLSLYAGWSTTYYTYPGMAGYQPQSFAEQWKGNGGEYVQLSLSIPIFSQGQRRLAIQQRKNDLDRAHTKLEEAERQRDITLLRAVNEVKAATAEAIQAQRLAAVRHQAYMLSLRQYELGLINAIEYQTASQAYLNAEADHLNAQLQLRLKEHQLNYYMTGQLLLN